MAFHDLHCHSTYSDGLLTPAELVQRASTRGVGVLALTDHDDVAGVAEALDAAADARIRLVCGAEISVSWESQTIHLVALGVDPGHPGLVEGLAGIRAGRDTRARRIGQSLERAGIPGAFEGARRYVTSEPLISRTHFARYLVEAGYVREVSAVFKRFLTPGKPGYVPHAWATLSEAISWTRAAGGQAVLAHPGRYRLTATGMRRLLAEFRELGGDAIEVLSASHTPAQCTEFGTYARAFGLLASSGSDFHGPAESRIDLGALPELPVAVVPVWSRW